MKREALRADTAFGFLDRQTASEQLHHPVLISNDDANTMLRGILDELRRSRSFLFSVAFVTTDALAMLKQPLLDFVAAGGTGRIVTSTYLNFNAPDALRELLALPGIEVYAHLDPKRGFHSKGYVFDQELGTTAIIGSSNLTSNALLRNREWNLRFSALPEGDIAEQLRTAVDRQIDEAVVLTHELIDAYAIEYAQRPQLVATPVDGFLPPASSGIPTTIVPNSMQEEALERIERLRLAGERRALVISATGTGKTILGALEVRQAKPRKMLFVVHREQIVDKALSEFRRVLEETADQFGKFVAQRRDLDRRYVFATIQSISRPGALEEIEAAGFDYVMIDEVHRSGSRTYREMIDRLTPDFLLGLTATPERTDAVDVFELFEHNVAYEIRLQAALEADMLVPFHYYGVQDFQYEDGTTVDETAQLSRLVAPERVHHLLRMIERYGHNGEVRGLIFCSRVEEARELNELLNLSAVNGRRLRTEALTGAQSQQERTAVVERLEAGELDYILTVDIFNEGIDIPSVNQVVMMRQTQSRIIFTQQLGRGLRLSEGKDHLRVIDFIGNYTNNYMIPMALFGDSSLSKDQLRRQVLGAQTAGAISGLSSVNFDEIARQKILDSITDTTLDSLANLKTAYREMHQRLGQQPWLMDFARFDTVDPVVLATARLKTYWDFLVKVETVEQAPTEAQRGYLIMLERELLPGKRPHELLLLQTLLGGESLTRYEFRKMLRSQGLDDDPLTVMSAERVLTYAFFTVTEKETYGGTGVLETPGQGYELSQAFRDQWEFDEMFRAHVRDAVETGLYLARHRHGWTSRLQQGHRYSRKDVCRLLGWKTNQQGVVNGYKIDKATGTCPVFITYHKDDDVSASTKYEDKLLDPSTVRWYTRSRKTLQSSDERAIAADEVSLHVFAKKDDAEGTDFYYLGQAAPREAEQSQMPDDSGAMLPVVTMKLDLETPLEDSLYEYFLRPTSPGASM
ncbi:DUF3427 domain-containing protein [Kocuria sp. SL71]|uniref:DUF3427 domain-containing protein n=1 Tax=Kocuria sp. SL71 TaxID=2995151 RepID=UPI002272E693|nr:DEAD/DEAH box helicase [Kocuria sp. SL71]MCY1683858.1 DEAD/DEAH box helicase [Kocuria sp. SL71]